MPATNAVWLEEQARLRDERRRLSNELVGRLVRLTHDIVAQDGDALRRGHRLRVKSHYQGRYMLADPSTGMVVVGGCVRPSFELVESGA